eukprot:TRINITY_DN23000_c0_g1_i1.p2 TRINITY_DN23000_c0_g1~~TRINITY_DN23000_c0_g1_i1.p2  ORF type:complete len:156 (+),score=22.75 TRINITY_DN23000_c0_g1_i1:119-586(+)
MERDPCPARIWNDTGAAFSMGCIGGTLWHGLKGIKDGGSGGRVSYAMTMIRTRAPPLGGSFAAWGGLFSSFDCLFAYVRKTEDPWNAIASGFVTGGILAARGGPKAALRSAIVGGIILGIIEGVSFMLGRVMVGEDPNAVAPENMPPPPPSHGSR